VIRILAVTLGVAVLVAATAAAVELLHDRELLVPPPDAVAEQFVRSVMAKRFEPARAYLLEPGSVSREQLEELQSRLGEGENPDAEIVSRDQESATVDVVIKETTFTIPLAWDKGWKVAALP
jgi:hypothetical protein